MWTRHVATDTRVAPDEIFVQDAVGDDGSRRRPRLPRSWRPVLLVAVLIGAGFVTLGIAALSHTGFSTERPTLPRHDVWTLPHTPLLAVGEIAFGSLMIVGAVIPGAARAVLTVLGVGALALGAAVLAGVASDRLSHWFAVTHRSGALFVATGVVTLVVVWWSPGALAARHRRWTTQRYSIH